ncbi:MAG TPA: OsmC family protein [Acidimicrobiales bacterium]|nr:OsmC family protein [Acidimicrobiales bacterium]
MTTTRHLARAIGSTGSGVPAYRVELRAGPHQLVADEPADTGGGDVGPSPLGLLVSALAACTATTLRMYAERHGWELGSIEVDTRYDVDDQRRGTIVRTITLPAEVAGSQLDALASIAERTPVTRAIREGTPITTTLRPDA